MGEPLSFWDKIVHVFMRTKVGAFWKQNRCRWFGHRWYYNYKHEKYCFKCHKVVGGKNDFVHGKMQK